MKAEREGNRLQRSILSGMFFIFLLLIAVFLGYMMFGRTPAPAPQESPITTAPPPLDNATPSATPDSLPAAPSDITAKNAAVYDILVGWQDKSHNEDGFNVYRQRTDVPGDLIKAGATGANETSFNDPYTYCGETYEYIIASYNSLGESPTEVCWSITLPPCPTPKSLTESEGVNKGYNFLTGAAGANSDFYLVTDDDGLPTFMADQSGQYGLLDLGDVGEMPLWHVDLPLSTQYVKDGVAAVNGHTYAALATDHTSVIVSTVNSAGKTAGLKYIVWRPGDEKTGACTVGRQGRDPKPPRTCTCQNGTLQVLNRVTAAVSDPRCTEAQQNVACECHGDDLVFEPGPLTHQPAIYPKDPVCTDATCECKGPDWVCSNGYKIASSPRCATTTQVVTEPPPDCTCKGTTWVCSNGTQNPNDRRCIPATQVVTEPPPDQTCFCEVANSAWNGEYVCVNSATGAELSRRHDEAQCPMPFCGNGSVEGTEECDGGGCGRNGTCKADCTCEKACTCECVNTASTPICRDTCSGQRCSA